MRAQSLLKTGLVLTLWSAVTSWAGDVYVIVNADVILGPDEIRNVFVGEKQLSGNVKLVPMDNAAAQADFLSKVVKMDPAKYNSMWVKKGFRDGLSAPLVRGSDAETVHAVKSTPGAVGYVSKAPAGVKVIQRY